MTATLLTFGKWPEIYPPKQNSHCNYTIYSTLVNINIKQPFITYAFNTPPSWQTLFHAQPDIHMWFTPFPKHLICVPYVECAGKHRVKERIVYFSANIRSLMHETRHDMWILNTTRLCLSPFKLIIIFNLNVIMIWVCLWGSVLYAPINRRTLRL